MVLSWAPTCGECFYCQSDHVNLCETYAPRVLDGGLLDGTSRLRTMSGEEIRHYSFLSTWAEMTVVPETSCIVVDPEIPLGPASLVGCAVMTGIGAATTLVIKRSRLVTASAEKLLLYQLSVSAVMALPMLLFAGPVFRHVTFVPTAALLFQAPKRHPNYSQHNQGEPQAFRFHGVHYSFSCGR